MAKTTMRMVTMQNEDDARALMRLRNQSRRGKTEIAVLVAGPEDGDFTVMGLSDAIENDFLYEWSV